MEDIVRPVVGLGDSKRPADRSFDPTPFRSAAKQVIAANLPAIFQRLYRKFQANPANRAKLRRSDREQANANTIRDGQRRLLGSWRTHRSGGYFMKANALLPILLLAGCALDPQPAEEKYEVEYGRDSAWVEAVENFERFKRSCRAARGHVQVRGAGSRVQRGPTTKEMNSATCVRYRNR